MKPAASTGGVLIVCVTGDFLNKLNSMWRDIQGTGNFLNKLNSMWHDIQGIGDFLNKLNSMWRHIQVIGDFFSWTPCGVIFKWLVTF